MPTSISQLENTKRVVDSDQLEVAREPFAAGDSVKMPIGFLRLFMAAPNADWRDGCRLAATGNVDIATALEAGDSIDGVVLAEGDRVLLPLQTDPTQNGVYVAVAAAAGAASRAADFDVDAEVLNGAAFFIFEGTANARKAFSVTSPDPHVVGTDDIIFAEFAPALGGAVEVLEAGVSRVSAATAIDVLSGGVVTDEGGGVAGLAIAGGAGGNGGLIQIAKKDFSAGSALDWTVDVTGHDSVRIVVDGLGFSAPDFLSCVVSTDGVTFDEGVSDYLWTRWSDTANDRFADDSFQWVGKIQDSAGNSMVVEMFNLSAVSLRTQSLCVAVLDGSSSGGIRHGVRDSAQVDTHLKVFAEAGSTINAGVIRVLAHGRDGGGVFEIDLSTTGGSTTAVDFADDLPDLQPGDVLEITVLDARPTSDGSRLWMQVSDDNQATWESTNYQGFVNAETTGVANKSSAGTTGFDFVSQTTNFNINAGLGEGYTGVGILYHARDAVYKKFTAIGTSGSTSGAHLSQISSFTHKQANVATDLRFGMDSNFVSGKIILKVIKF